MVTTHLGRIRIGMMTKWTKAHRATANRIAKRYDGRINLLDSPDIATAEMIIEVETHATLARAVRRLKPSTDVVYIAVTNREALAEALRLTADTDIGVMDPQGNILKAYGNSSPAILGGDDPKRAAGRSKDETTPRSKQ